MERSPEYELHIAPRAQRELERLPLTDYERVDERIGPLAQNPRPHGAAKLWDKAYRIRIGPWRVIYIVDDAKRVVVITGVLRREKDTYRLT